MGRQKWSIGDISDQSNKTVLVTGANSGLGLATATALAARGARVLLGCRNADRAESAAREILAVNEQADVQIVELDLADLASIQKAAEYIGATEAGLDILVNNAGIMAVDHGFTVDGFEKQLGTNHLGHFALSGRLLPLLLATPNARIVSVASLAHRHAKIDFDDLSGDKRYSRWQRYGASKVANLLFTFELTRRLSAAGASQIAVAAHPGASATHLGDNLPMGRALAPLFSLLGQSAEMGAQASLRAATDPGVKGGEYYGSGDFGGMRGAPTRVTSSGYSHDLDVAEMLWQVSAELTGVDYDFHP